MTDQEEAALANDGRAKFKVWWIPQVPMAPFETEVPDYETAILVSNILATYDQFQLDNKIKPDYCNMGGISMSHPDIDGGDWNEIDDDTAEVYGWKEPD